MPSCPNDQASPIDVACRYRYTTAAAHTGLPWNINEAKILKTISLKTERNFYF